MSTNAETFTNLGFTTEVAGNGEKNEGTWEKRVGWFTVKVETVDWKWISDNVPDNPYKGHVVPVAQEPEFSVYLPHSCDEWVVVEGGDDKQVETMTQFAADTLEAATVLAEIRRAVLS